MPFGGSLFGYSEEGAVFSGEFDFPVGAAVFGGTLFGYTSATALFSGEINNVSPEVGKQSFEPVFGGSMFGYVSATLPLVGEIYSQPFFNALVGDSEEALEISPVAFIGNEDFSDYLESMDFDFSAGGFYSVLEAKLIGEHNGLLNKILTIGVKMKFSGGTSATVLFFKGIIEGARKNKGATNKTTKLTAYDIGKAFLSLPVEPATIQGLASDVIKNQLSSSGFGAYDVNIFDYTFEETTVYYTSAYHIIRAISEESGQVISFTDSGGKFVLRSFGKPAGYSFTFGKNCVFNESPIDYVNSRINEIIVSGKTRTYTIKDVVDQADNGRKVGNPISLKFIDDEAGLINVGIRAIADSKADRLLLQLWPNPFVLPGRAYKYNNGTEEIGVVPYAKGFNFSWPQGAWDSLKCLIVNENWNPLEGPENSYEKLLASAVITGGLIQ